MCELRGCSSMDLLSLLVVLLLPLDSISTAIPAVQPALASAPHVHVKNGTYVGAHSDSYNQDFFLGVPFAQPPVGDLRLRQPQSLNTSWQGTHSATEYYYACVGYGVDTYIGAGNNVSEDCLTLNVVRPSGYEDQKLPVAVWIYGGGWYEGSARDPRYNLSFIVAQSTKIERPVIGVSINYRLHGWGWLYSNEVVEAGVTNLGLRDQRLALRWLQENIGAFGGDPGRVTIWGESAGAVSVCNHLLAYNGRDDGLFHGAIAESGPFGVGLVNPTRAVSTLAFKRITAKAGCTESNDKLDCLRQLSFSKYNHVLKSLYPVAEGYHQVVFGPLVDNDIIARNAIDQLRAGDFVKVPYIMGDNSDEGADFIPLGINNNARFKGYFRRYGINNKTLDDIATLYPQNSPQDILQNHPKQFNKTIGRQFKRTATVEGDIAFKAPRRLAARQWLKHAASTSKGSKNAPLYTYRFNTIPNGVPAYLGVTHFTEVAFVFNNLHGYGYTDTGPPPYFGPDPFADKGKSYKDLSDMMSSMWVNFFNNGDPNFQDTSKAEIRWPTYDNEKVIVFDADQGNSIESDDYRAKGINYLVEQYLKGDQPWGRHELD